MSVMKQKKNVFARVLRVAVAVVATACAFGILGMSEFEANAQAIGSGDLDDGNKVCYNSIHAKEGSKVRYCPTCEFVDGTDDLLSFAKKCKGK